MDVFLLENLRTIIHILEWKRLEIILTSKASKNVDKFRQAHQPDTSSNVSLASQINLVAINGVSYQNENSL